MPNFIIRTAKKQDAAALLKIYTPYVLNTCISFEETPPTLSEFETRIEKFCDKYAYFVWEKESGEIAGYAYASEHGGRAGYKYSVNVSVYLAQQYCGQGGGKALYNALFDALSKKGFYTAFAAVTLPNEQSVALHEKMGFTPCGVFHNVGYKHGKWLTLQWLQKQLQCYEG